MHACGRLFRQGLRLVSRAVAAIFVHRGKLAGGVPAFVHGRGGLLVRAQDGAGFEVFRAFSPFARCLLGPKNTPCPAPAGSNVSRVATADWSVASEVLCFHSVTLRYACVTLALLSVFHSVTKRYAISKTSFLF